MHELTFLHQKTLNMFRSLAMFLRWKNAVFVTLEIWFSKDSLLSNIMHINKVHNKVHIHALLQVTWTEMCVGSVCTQPPYNDKDPPGVFFFVIKCLNVLFKCLPLSQIELISVWRHTDKAPPTIVWLTGVFQHRLHWCLTSDPSWVSCHQSFHRRSRCRQEWLLRDWGVLLMDVIMNIAVVIYSRHLSRWRRLRLVLKGMRPRST